MSRRHTVPWLFPILLLTACADDGKVAAPEKPQFSSNAEYVLDDLGTFDGLHTFAEAINASGDVVGGANPPVGPSSRAWLWTARTGFTDLGSLGGTSNFATGINARGQVVGVSARAPNTLEAAFLWTARDGLTDLFPDLPPRTDAWAINSAGTITGILGRAGLISTNPMRPQPYVWSRNRGMVMLGKLPGGDGAVAREINERGDVVGEANVGPDAMGLHATLWYADGTLRDLGWVGPIPSSGGARGINNRGSVAGIRVEPPLGTRAFYWTERTGMITLLPESALRSVGLAINDSDVVVGAVVLAGSPVQHAFAWSEQMGFVVLPGLGGNAEARSINNRGDIAGYARDATGLTHAVVWRQH